MCGLAAIVSIAKYGKIPNGKINKIEKNVIKNRKDQLQRLSLAKGISPLQCGEPWFESLLGNVSTFSV